MLEKILKIFKDNLYAISLYARQIAGTVVILLIARYLSVYNFGLFSSYKNIAGYIFVLANLNYNDYILVSTKAEPSKVRQKVALFITHAILYGAAANYSMHITASGNQAAKIPMQIELCICSIVTLFALSKFGIYGAAISNLITMTYMLIRYKIFSDNWLKIKEKMQ